MCDKLPLIGNRFIRGYQAHLDHFVVPTPTGCSSCCCLGFGLPRLLRCLLRHLQIFQVEPTNCNCYTACKFRFHQQLRYIKLTSALSGSSSESSINSFEMFFRFDILAGSMWTLNLPREFRKQLRARAMHIIT